MKNKKFERAARLNRMKALTFTVLFHVGLFGGMAIVTSDGSEDSFPVKIKEWVESKLPGDDAAKMVSSENEGA